MARTKIPFLHHAIYISVFGAIIGSFIWREIIPKYRIKPKFDEETDMHMKSKLARLQSYEMQKLQREAQEKRKAELMKE